MAIRFPPEVGLRNAIRLCRSLQTCDVSGRSWYHAAVCTELGKPLQLLKRERTALDEDQVRLAVKRAAINFGDILVVQGKYQLKPALPFTPGSEITGQILEVGSKVTRFKSGDTVVGTLSFGGYAEELVAAESSFHPVASHVSLEEAAATVVSYGTAELALQRTIQIKSSDVILVTAAAGALGLAAVDLAANVYKASVIGACGGPDKCKLASKYGAKFTIDYKTENIRERVKEITKGKGVDIVFDVVGGKVLEESLRCLAFEGKLLTLGYTSGEIPKIPANLLLVKNISAHGVFWGSYGLNNPEIYLKSITTVLRLLQEGKIKPHVGKVFPLSQVNEALKYVATRQSTGKVILDCTKA